MNKSILRKPILFRLTLLASTILFLGYSGCTTNKTDVVTKTDHGGEGARNMRLVGYNDLQGRSAYQMVILKRDNRWLLYVGHHSGEFLNPLTGKVETNGTSVLDVTDPANPIYLAHIPGNNHQHIQVMEGEQLPGGKKGHIYLLHNIGRGTANEILDVTDPKNPQFVSTVNYAEESMTGLKAVHVNLWEPDTGIAYIPSSVSGWWPTKILKVYDLSDPYHPRFIRDFGLPGTQPGSGGTEEGGRPEGIHEVTVYGNRIYVAYGTFDHGVMQILDRDKLLHGDPKSPDPMSPTIENLNYPVISQLRMPDYWGAHTPRPIIGIKIPDYENDKRGYIRNFIHLTSEGISYPCDRERYMTHFIDITDEKHPFPVSNFQISATEDGFDFCTRGTFGPQTPQSSYGPPYYKKIEFVSYFSAGVRAIDIRDPFKPEEIGYFIPKANKNTVAAVPNPDSLPKDYVPVAVTNSVEVDDRGYIYIADRANTGLHILELTGDAAKIALGD
jgi:hypothetical protein